MATDPTQQNVFITGTDLPDWASEATQNGILNAIKASDSNNVKLTSNMNTLMGNLISIMAGDRNAAKNYRESIRKSQEESAEIRKQLSELNTTIKQVSDNTEQANNEDRARDKKDDERVNRQISQIKQLGLFDKLKFRADMAMAKSQKDQFRVMNNYLGDISLSSKELKDKFPEVLEKLGAPSSIAEGPGNDAFGGILALTGKTNMFKNLMEGAVAAYSASQVPFEMMMQQVKDRFEITTELRQSGLLEDLGASFVDTTKAFSDNKMTIVEATQFVREFSKAVGVTGASAALEFVNKMAYSTGMMDRFGISFSQVAKISGTYLDTLERTGLLEQISATERDRGMQSFMSAVEGVSMTLKTSLEESAKMISEYLSRDDISAMLMTNSMNLSQEVITQIGAMAKMGPLGEIVAKGAIDPNRFMLTQEFQALNNPALAGVRGIVEQMMSDLRSGRGTDELIAQYGKQMSEIISNDPLVAQLVAMDSDVASIVAGVGRLAQTSQDAINEISVPEVDKAEQRRQDAERRRAAAIEGLYANTLKTLDNSRELERILKAQTGIIEGQISIIDTLSQNATDMLATILSYSAKANEALMGTINVFAQGVADLFPEHHMAGQARDIGETTAAYQERKRVEREDIISGRDGGPGIEAARVQEITQMVEDTEYGTFWVSQSKEIERANQRISDLEAMKSNVTEPKERELIDTYIAEEQANIIAKGLTTATTDLVSNLDKLMREKYYESYEDVKTESEYGTNTSPKFNQEESTAVIREAAPEAIRMRLEEVIPVVNDMDQVSMEIKQSVLAQEAVNNMRETGITPEEMKSIVDDMFLNPELVEMLGNNANSFKEALLSELPGIITPPIDTSFIDILQRPTNGIVDPIEVEAYNNISDIVGGNETYANEQQFKQFFDEMKVDNNYTNEQMIEKLDKMLTTIQNNKPDLEYTTGKEDVRLLVKTITDLITKLA